MTYAERHAWPNMVEAALLLAAAVTFGWWYLRRILPFDERLRTVLAADAVLAAIIFAVLLAYAAGALLRVAAIRAREDARRRAMEGAPDAMPQVVSGPAVPSTLSDDGQVITLSWPVRGWQRIALALGAVLSAAFPLGMFVFAIGFAVHWVEIVDRIASASVRPVASVPAAPLIAVAFALALLLIALSFVRELPNLFDPTVVHLTADAEALSAVSLYGRVTRVPWHAARLLETRRRRFFSRQTRLDAYSAAYALHAPRAAIVWAGRGDANGTMSLRAEALLAAVMRRSGLRLRTLDLETSGGQPLPGEDAARLARGITRTATVGAAIGGAAVMLTYSGEGRLAGLSLLGVVAIWLWMYAGGRREVAHKRDDSMAGAETLRLDVAAPPLDPSTVYEVPLNTPTDAKRKMRDMLLTAALMLALAPVFGLILYETLTHHPTVGDAILFAALAMVSLAMGIGLILGAWRFPPASRSIFAADDGLRIGRLDGAPLLPWDAVADIQLEIVNDKPRRYLVSADTHRFFSGDVPIPWSAVAHPDISPLTQGATASISPDELAALVAARSGHPIEVVRRGRT